MLFNAVQSLRIAQHPAEAVHAAVGGDDLPSFNFPKPWDEVKYADAAELKAQTDDLRVTAELVDGKVKPLFPRIG